MLDKFHKLLFVEKYKNLFDFVFCLQLSIYCQNLYKALLPATEGNKVFACVCVYVCLSTQL